MYHFEVCKELALASISLDKIYLKALAPNTGSVVT